MLRIFLIPLLAFLSSLVFAADAITEDLVLEMLAKEKQFLQTKNVSGFSSLLIEDYVSVYKDVTVGKEQTLRKVSELFLSADKMLIKPELTSIKISDDGKSADILLRTVEKYLFVRGSAQTVDSYINYSKATVVLDSGTIKYKHSKFIRSE